MEEAIEIIKSCLYALQLQQAESFIPAHSRIKIQNEAVEKIVVFLNKETNNDKI